MSHSFTRTDKVYHSPSWWSIYAEEPRGDFRIEWLIDKDEKAQAIKRYVSYRMDQALPRDYPWLVDARIVQARKSFESVLLAFWKEEV